MLSNEYIIQKSVVLLPANSIHSFLQKRCSNSSIASFVFSSCVDSTFLSTMTCSLSLADGVDLILVKAEENFSGSVK